MSKKEGEKVGGEYATMLNHLAVSISNHGKITGTMNKKQLALSTLFNVESFRSILIPGELTCLPRKKNESTQIDGGFFYARLATDKSGVIGHKHFVVIEKYTDSTWQLEKLIPLQKISSVEFKSVSETENAFDAVIIIPHFSSISTPKSIHF